MVSEHRLILFVGPLMKSRHADFMSVNCFFDDSFIQELHYHHQRDNNPSGRTFAHLFDFLLHVHTITYITVCFCTSTVCSMDMFTPLLTLLFVSVLQHCAQWTCSHHYLHYCLFLYFNSVLNCRAIAILRTFTLFLW